MLGSSAISINNKKENDENLLVIKEMGIDKKVIIIRKGKKKQFIGLFE